MIDLRERELRGGHVVLQFEFPAEVGGVFEAEIVGDFFDGFAGEEPFSGEQQAALIEPVLR